MRSKMIELPDIPPNLLREFQKLGHKLDGYGDLNEKLLTIYDYIDLFNADFLQAYMCCKQGCSHCCKIDIQITQWEAAVIYQKTGVPMRAVIGVTTNNTAPCPFLSAEDVCTIYKYRPLPCRIFHAAGDPDNCKPGRKSIQYGAPPTFGNNTFQSLVHFVYANNMAWGWGAGDIRDFFR